MVLVQIHYPDPLYTQRDRRREGKLLSQTPEIYASRGKKSAHFRAKPRYGCKKRNPQLSKLIKFGPHISTLLESTRAGLYDTKILRA